MSQLRIGSTESGYRIDSVLGEGGFGTVYRVQRRGESPCALKVLHADHMSVPQLVTRFEREVATIRSLRHDSCLDVYESGRLRDGSPFFAMELLEGEDLKERLNRTGRMEVAEAMSILQPICEVLQLAHSRSIVHRDIKASNVFVCSSGRVVLLDFGIAKFVGGPGMTLTMSRQLVGTPSAMSPEQLRGEEIDARTDVYALGALSYHMLTGSRVFSGSSASMIQHLHKHAARPRVSDRVPVGFSIDRLLLSAMAIERDRRPADAGEFWQELRAAALGREGAGEGCGDALVVYGRLERWVDNARDAQQAIEQLATAIRRLEEQGFELSSSHSRGFVCAQLLDLHRADAQAEAAERAVAGVRDELAEDTDWPVQLHVRRGKVDLSGELMSGGDALQPAATPTS